MTRTVLAIDIGGTKIAAGLVDEAGTVLAEAVVPTPTGDAEQTWQAVADCARQVLGDTSVEAIGACCAGPVDIGAGTVSPINITCWREFPLRARLRELATGATVELAGDGVCMALGEHWLGAGQGSEFMLGMVVSTGVGGGLVLGGRPYPGRTGNAGHIGHVIVEDDGWPCTCGGRGCVETVASGPNMVRWARTQGWQAPDHADAAHLAAAANHGDKIALATFQRGGRAVGMAIAATAVVCDLELAVIGGGVSKAGDLLFDPVREALADHARLSYVDQLRIAPAALAKNAGMIGAAAMALRADI
ncbi:glucokinase [Herbihabitans rhizosphaerae]|uniref:Glucokinase n=1 Tax=Herbihabitans rhizosphaerae TaxID=1872711 RepID=A0A4Q7KN65_9PSEU|nr:ROK family protein [Herbihabitans rhizosphaerae]RZS37766.1 glucokinase [Herbihabitans rhizosphaerae]